MGGSAPSRECRARRVSAAECARRHTEESLRSRTLQGGPVTSPDVSCRLRPALPDGATRSGGRVGGRQADRLDGEPAAVRRARRARAGVSPDRRPRPGDHPGLWRRVRGQALGRMRRRGCPAGKGGRCAGPPSMDAGRGVHLGGVSPGGRDRRRGKPRRIRPAHVLAFPQHQLGLPGGPDSLPHGQERRPVRGVKSPAPAWFLPGPCGDGEHVRPRVLHGRACCRGRARPAGVSPRPPGARPTPRRPGGGRAPFRLVLPVEAIGAGRGRGPCVQHGQGLIRGRLRRGRSRP